MAERQYHLKFDNANARAVDEYLEYRRIVGDDDGGELMTPEQFEEYKKKVLPMRMKNRLFVSYSAPTGMDCKMVGPETPCFCTHRYKQHKTDFEEIPKERPIKLPCRVKGCKCVCYHFVPLNGSQPIRCTCKHLSDEHSEEEPFRCKKRGCIKCTGFTSSFTCGCGASYKQHKMIVETADEREARGHPIGQATPYAAMGGLTGFSSLADGYMRLDPSGRGAPNKGFLEQSITSDDNPFLRSNVQAIKAHQMKKKAVSGVNIDPEDEIFSDMAERISQMKKPSESDMDYYERRYQERQAAERGRNVQGGYGQLNSAPRKAALEPKPSTPKPRTPQP